MTYSSDKRGYVVLLLPSMDLRHQKPFFNQNPQHPEHAIFPTARLFKKEQRSARGSANITHLIVSIRVLPEWGLCIEAVSRMVKNSHLQAVDNILFTEKANPVFVPSAN